MALPQPPTPGLLYRKPGTVTTAQVFMWLQFSVVICCGAAMSSAALFTAGLLAELGLAEGHLDAVESVAAMVATVAVATAAISIILGVLAAKLGAGRRWAQVATIVAMLAAVVVGFVGVYTGFELSESAGAEADGSSAVWATVSMAMPMTTLICLCTGSANQWFRQGGRDPWPPPPAYPQPYPYPYPHGY